MQHERALSDFDKSISLNQNYPDPACNKGKCLAALGQYDKALAAFDKALSLRPDFAEAWLGRGHVSHDLKKYDEALAAYDKALNLRPGLAPAWLGRGRVCARLNRAPEALAAFDKALAFKPDLAEAWLGRGHVLHDVRKYDEALAAYERALSMQPDLAPAWLGRGNVLHDIRKYDEALPAFDRAIGLKSDLAESWLGRGSVFYGLRMHDEAFTAFDKALALKTDLAEAWLGRSNVFRDLKKYDEALAACDRALSFQPDMATAWLGRGNVFAELDRRDEAFAAYDRALALKPDLAAAYTSRGVLRFELMQVKEAIADYDKAISIEPNDAETYWNKSMALLLSGEFNEGWNLFEWRWKTRIMRSLRRDLPQPLWLGKESLRGKTILLCSEQGLGDAIQFCRYTKLVADLGAQVILEVPKPLKHVLANLAGAAKVIEAGSALPSFDYQCPLMSLPFAFKTDLSNIPADIPYIKSETEKYQYWRAKLGETKRPRVGLAWSGGNQPESWRVNERKRVPLAKLAALKDIDVVFYSLQKGQPAESELAELINNNWNGPHITDFTSELVDFSDTAALVDNLDLVISVDTSTAHLAGAMGKPVWILNRFDSDWRWLLERTDSPWYPTARLYRQASPGNWDDLVQRVRDDLLSFCRSR
ncbi:MAG TPA: tetratricopeptide repeat protein [Pseudolabrys sp.]